MLKVNNSKLQNFVQRFHLADEKIKALRGRIQIVKHVHQTLDFGYDRKKQTPLLKAELSYHDKSIVIICTLYEY